MKKNSIIISIIIIVVIILTFINHLVYNKYYNSKIIDITTQIIENNPNIDKTEIANIIKNPTQSNENILKDYGYSEKDLYLINDLKYKVLINTIINITITLSITVIIIIILSKKQNQRKKEINELINYLEEINKGNYNIDIKKYNETNLSKLRNSIYQTTKVLKEQSIRLNKEKLILKDNITDISHQLNTPLTSISLMLETLIEDKNLPKEKEADYLNKISKKTEDITYLIQVLLKLSRLDTSIIEFVPEDVNVKTILMNVKNSLEELSNNKDIQIRINCLDNIFIYIDKKWQEEALKNILKNCIEYTKVKGTIEIDVIDNNFYTEITIKDEGPGIKKEELSKIFDRFHKTKDSKGYGIGLNLAKTIIKKDNGFIEVNSKENKYTKFKIKYMKVK